MRTGPSLLLRVWPLLHNCGACCNHFLPLQGIGQCLSLVTYWWPLAFNRPRYLAGGEYHVDSATTAAAAAQPLLTNLFELWERSTQYRQFQSYWQHPREFASIPAHLESQRLPAWAVLLLGYIQYSKCVFVFKAPNTVEPVPACGQQLEWRQALAPDSKNREESVFMIVVHFK